MDDTNIHIAKNLHPPSLDLINLCPRTTRHSLATREKFLIHPKAIINIISRLRRGKSPGNELDSLDIFIQLISLYKRAKKTSSTTFVDPTTLATFFTIVANGDVPPRIVDLLRTTYQVLLHKDVNNPDKLRPLGIPSAIRRIAAASILHVYRGRFANYLLPFNFAFGIGGGLDLVTNTMTLGVDKFITVPESKGLLPSRALISLDIKNMFNAVSRQKLRHLMTNEFPELAAFADCLYEDRGVTMLKRGDGTWERIEVHEGFSQGCPLSPIFAGFVLNRILTNVYNDLLPRIRDRLQSHTLLDDDQGGQPITMGYVDDVNILLPIRDVLFFLERFEHHGIPLGARLNSEKTRIMTSTSGSSTFERLNKSPDPLLYSDGQQLLAAIQKYSTTNGSPHEECNGLRILGIPVGSPSFCQQFISDALATTTSRSSIIVDKLESRQTIMQVFKQCTSHKLTHLFPYDVISSFTTTSTLPQHWNTWESPFTRQYDSLIQSIISPITSNPAIPQHSINIACTPSKHGGLGLPHPRPSAISSLILRTKRNLQQTLQGIYTSPSSPLLHLPPSIVSLWKPWKTSTSPLFQLYRHYSPPLRNICTPQDTTNRDHHFIFKSSLPRCHDHINAEIASRSRTIIQHDLSHDIEGLYQLPDILEPRSSAALLDMSRLQSSNRRTNKDFTIALCRKLRLPLIHGTHRCKCKKIIDPFGDHIMSCTHHNKTVMSNCIRDGLCRLLRDVCTSVDLTSSPTMVTTEPENILPCLPKLRPFDVCIRLDHAQHDSIWKSTLNTIGIDVTCVTSTPSPPNPSQAARLNELQSRLQKGEKEKFCRSAYSCKLSNTTLSGDAIMHNIISNDMTLIPAAISPHGHTGDLLNRFLYGSTPTPINFTANFPHAATAERIARTKCPSGILPRANSLWRRHHPDLNYGDSYHSPDPMSFFNKHLGLIISKASTSHLSRGLGKLSFVFVQNHNGNASDVLPNTSEFSVPTP